MVYHKRKVFLRIIPLILFLNFILSVQVFAALSGSYTINPGAAASFSNYQNWTSAINDLKLGTRTDGGVINGPGVSGAVTFTVSGGTYVGQIDIPFINGVSAINTITFDGGNPSNCFLQMNNTSASNLAVVRFNSSKFVTLKNFTITSTVSIVTINSYGVNFVGTNAAPCNDNTLKNCIVNVSFIPYLSYFDQTTFGILFNGDFIKSDVPGSFRNNVLDGCTINNGFYGIYSLGISDSCTGNVIKNNTLINYSSVGIYLTNSGASKVLNNTVSSNNVSTDFSLNYWFWFNVGIIMDGCTASTTDFTDISGNKVKSFWQTGIYLYGCTGKPGNRTRLSNNFVSNGGIKSFAYDYAGVYFGFSDYTDIWNNSINIDYPGAANFNSAFHDDGSSKFLDVRNNIFSYATSGKGLPYFSNGKIINYTAFDNNIFYNADSAKTGVIDKILYTTAAVGGANANSFSVNPNFNSSTDLHIRNYSFGKIGSAGTVTTDIDGETRGTPPLIGADDFPALANNDIGVASLISPLTAVNTGLQSISVQISNSGLNTVTTGTIRYSLNGGATVSQGWNGSLAAGANTTFTFTTQGNFIAGLNKLKVFSSLPNGAVDSYFGNDTLNATVYSKLNGNYTINPSAVPSATNFTSFSSAVTGLNGGLVTGAVVIVVSPHVYSEQIELRTINGVSATNTVKFDGVDTSKVTLTWNGTFGKQHTVRLAGCNYVTFARMRITGSNPNYAWPIHFATDRTDYNRIVGCVVTVPTVIDDLNQCSILFGGAEGYVPPYIVPYVSLKYNNIDSCTIRGGKSGIIYIGGVFYGGPDTVNAINNNFTNNRISNVNSWGMYLYQAYGSKVLNNFISPNHSAGGGIFNSACRSSINAFSEISGNVITNFGFTPFAAVGNVQGGLCMYSCSGGAAGNFRVSNNMIGGLLVNSNCMFLNGCKKMDIIFNSLNYNQSFALAPNYAAIQSVTGDKTLTIKNNILAVTGSGGSASCFFEAIDTVKYSPTNFDNNIFYNTSNTNLAVVGGVIYTPSTLIGGGGYNLHSQITDPTFVSSTNLHITFQSNLGTPISGISSDIDGQARNISTPCIGADEINIGCTPPAIAGLISGTDTICQGQKSITYSISPISGATGYTWVTPPGASIVSGSNTNNITVNFSPSAEDGTITVQGINSCNKGSISLPLALTINTPPIVTVSPKEASCNGKCNGSAIVTVSGSGGYNYKWSNTATVPEVTGLCAGTYNLTVQDIYGCSVNNSVAIAQPTVLTVTSTQKDASCLSCQNGTAAITASGGTAPYTYNWSTGETTASISNLSAKKYFGCVTDANGCEFCDSVTIGINTAVSKTEDESGFDIFPNPSDGIVTVKLGKAGEKVTAEIFSITGQKIFEETFSNTVLRRIDFSDYGRNIYILRITSEKQVWQRKVTIQ